MLLNRNDALRLFQDKIAMRLSNRDSIDKEAHPHVICMAGPGTGKSRLADYGLVALRKTTPTSHPELAALANHKAALAIHITFNCNSPFDQLDKDIGPDAAVGGRLLASYFRFGFQRYVFPECLSRLTIHVSIQTILNDHLSRHPGVDPKDVLVYVAVDDVSNICLFNEEWTISKGKSYLKSILDKLAALYSDTEYFLVTMVTGTVLGPTSDILIGSQRPYVNLAVPLLSLAQSVQLAEDAFLRGGVPGGVSHNCKLLLSDIGGVPRFVWQAIEKVIKNRTSDTTISYERARFAIQDEISLRNGFLNLNDTSVIAKLLSTALLRQSIHPSSNCVPDKAYTWFELENQGVCFFSDRDSQGLVQIWLPLLHLELLLERFPVAANLVRNLYKSDWESWEKLGLMYEALLLTMYSLQDKAQVSVGDYYRGALVGEGAKDLLLTLPLNLPVTYSEMKTRYPETPGSSPPVKDATVVYKNCPGAKIDGFIWHLDPDVLRCFHFKHTINGSLFDYAAIRNKTTADMRSDVTHLLDTDVLPLHIYVTNREWKGDLAAVLASDVVVVTRAQLAGFFGRTFADRIGLMMFRED